MWLHPSKIFSLIIVLIVYLLSCQDVVAAHSKLTGLLSQSRPSRNGSPWTCTSNCAIISNSSPHVPSACSEFCQQNSWCRSKKTNGCQKAYRTHRYRHLLQPAKYGGRICTGHLWDESVCQPTGTCAVSQDCGDDFRCEESGRCIKRHLVCNGEPDCRDESDEANCEDAERYCDNLDPVPGIEKAAQGYNILTQKGVQIVYDHTYYGGQCESVYNGEWRELKYDAACERLYYGDDEKYYRKPFNVHFYQFLAHADSGFSSEFYEDSKDLLNALKKDSSWGRGFTFGIGPANVPVMVDIGFHLSGGKGTLKNFTQYEAKNVGFIRAVTKVQTARFKMRRNDIVLNEDMLQSLMELGDQYNYGMYARFINEYGTHFVTSGTMGGIFEYILVVNKDEMRKRDVTSETLSKCFGASLGLSYSDLETDVTISGQASYQECSKRGDQAADSDKHKSFIEDIIPRVQGGDAASVARFLGSGNTNAYRYWGRSLKLNPTVIDLELQPIDELLRRSTLANIETKRKNLKRALDEYLMEFNACRCGPCQNNGEPVLIYSSCVCECQAGSQGAACENTRRADRPIHGSWSCWTPWTSCQSGTRRRSRQCNNPAPQNGGAACAGRSLYTETC